MSIKNASEELKADREVVMAAIQNQGRAVSKELRADREIMLAAIQD